MHESKQETALVERRDIGVITAEIQFYKNQAGEAILEIGRRLNEAKEQLEHGGWLGWLNESVEFSEGTAQRFMRLAREYANPSPVVELGSSKALILLALPPAERDEFIEESHDVGGKEKSVSDMSKRELESAVRERAEALKAKAEAEAAAAEAKRVAEEAAAALKEADKRAAAAQREADDSTGALHDALYELERLRSTDPALPEEPDQQTLEAFRKEIAAEEKKAAEEKLKKKIDKATEGKAEAEGKLEAAIAERDRIETEREQEQAAAEERIIQLQRQLAAASSEHVTVFKTHFENAQGCINNMLDCLLKLKDEPVVRDKLATAIRALCEKTVQGLPSIEPESPYGGEESEEVA